MPAPPSTSGAIASRCDVSTAMIGATAAAASARSSRSRVDVPGRRRDERHAREPRDRQTARAPGSGARRAHRDDLLAPERDRDQIVAARRQLGEARARCARRHHLGDRADIVGLGDAHDDPGVRVAEPSDERGSGSTASVGSATKSSVPVSRVPRTAPPTRARAARSRSMRRAGPSNAWPASVSATERPSRWKSRTPSSASSRRTPSESDGWLTAARVGARREAALVDRPRGRSRPAGAP